MTDPSMSGFSMVPNWMLEADDVTANMVLAYVSIGTYTGRDGTAWPSLASIARRAKMSERAARTALRALEALGLVETTRRARQDQGQTSNLYRLHTSVTPRQEVQPPRQEVPPPPAPPAYEQEPREQTPTDVGVRETRARGSRLPEPFIVTAEMWEWAREKGLDRDWAREQTERFVDYWRGVSGQRGVKQDWPSTWRNWLRRAWDDRRAAPTARETPDERFRRLQALADSMEAGDGRLGLGQ